MKALRAVICLVFSVQLVSAQTPSPEAFLGYPAGSAFTYHHQVVAYTNLLARQNPDKVKLIPYGTTCEGRPLTVVAIGLPKHIAALEKIRQDNLKRAGLMKGKPDENGPVIVWLSYNIHGDEAVASEAAMQVMYQLVNGKDTLFRKVLQNVLVLVDPCLNPDGRERYVNWFNQVRGVHPDATAFSREHTPPWPGGRYNHYLFDLNRDWAWQVQKESQARLKLYNEWMPHLHADFHEMSAGSSYYFPPAARPFHTDITPWQREFNNLLGTYNRKYFDGNGWLYFTKYSFDLFYPSYGDTWPTYNGAIGVTYEQAGGGQAGLALARTGENDTLTLENRIARHLITSRATLEAASENAARIVSEFANFFDHARKEPAGKYKSYIISAEETGDNTEAFCELLTRQGISYGVLGRSLTAKATDLATDQEKTVAFRKDDILISGYQPKSGLLKILLESRPVLEDSLTYDITSWGLGYAYGIRVYGLTEKYLPQQTAPDSLINAIPEKRPYAYLVSWDSFREVRFLSELLRNHIKVRTANTSFETEGKRFAAGTLVVARAGNERLAGRFDELVTGIANRCRVVLNPVTTGMVSSGYDLGTGDVTVLRAPRVVTVGGAGVSPVAFGEIWHYFEQQLHYPITVVEADRMKNIPWNLVDVLILPSGNYSTLLDEKTLNTVRDWVSAGGRLIVMEGALSTFAGKAGFDLMLKNEGSGLREEEPLKPYGARTRDALRDDTPGSVYEVTLDLTHPLAFGYGQRPYYTLVRNVYRYDYLKNGWNVGYLGEDGYRSGFVGDRARQRLRNTLVIGCQESGRGRIVYLADNPVFRGFWYNGRLLFGNAVFR